MRKHLIQLPAGPSGRETIDRELIEAIQAYFECCAQGMAPRPELLEAWDRFFRICTPLIRQTIRARRIAEADENDCVQEVWEAVFAGLHGFGHDPDRARFQAWLLALTRHKAADVIRQRIRHPVERLGDEGEAAIPSRDADPATEYERRRTRVMVRRVLALLSRQLSPCTYRVFCLRWIEGRTIKQIAEESGLKPEQVRFRQHRAKQRFRQLLARHCWTDPSGPREH